MAAGRPAAEVSRLSSSAWLSLFPNPSGALWCPHRCNGRFISKHLEEVQALDTNSSLSMRGPSKMALSCLGRAGCRKLYLGTCSLGRSEPGKTGWISSIPRGSPCRHQCLPATRAISRLSVVCTGLRLNSPVVSPALNSKQHKQRPRGTRNEGRCSTHAFFHPRGIARICTP